MIGLVAITVVLCSLRLDTPLVSSAARALLTGLVFIMLASLALIAVGVFVEHLHLAHKLPDRMPLRKTILELSAAFSTYARDPRTLPSPSAFPSYGPFLHLPLFYALQHARGRLAEIRRPECGAGRNPRRAAGDPDHRVPSDLTLVRVGVREGLFQKR